MGRMGTMLRMASIGGNVENIENGGVENAETGKNVENGKNFENVENSDRERKRERERERGISIIL